MSRARNRAERFFEYDDIHGVVDGIFGEDMHAKRVESLANATLGVMSGASLAVHVIGQALAWAKGLVAKHAVKQVDRLLGNGKLDVWALFEYWVPYAVSGHQELVVALDWTDFDADGQATIMLTQLSRHGRSVPLVWQTVEKSTLAGQRNAYENDVLSRLHQTLPPGVAVTVVADRGFGDTKLLEALTATWGFGYVIRLRNNIYVTSAKGERRAAREWVGANGRARTLRQAAVTGEKYPVPTVVCVNATAMAEPWCLVASDPKASAKTLMTLYGKRWSIETTFRDAKDLRFGMGLSHLHTKSTARRDRLLLVGALAIVLLTLLGGAGEHLCYDRMLKANTVKRRTHSLFNQGAMLYNWMPTMPDKYFEPLMKRFNEMVLEHRVFKEAFGII